MARFRRRQRSAYEYVTADRSEGERLDFARLMLKYAGALAGLRQRAPDKPEEATRGAQGPGPARRRSGIGRWG